MLVGARNSEKTHPETDSEKWFRGDRDPPPIHTHTGTEDGLGRKESSSEGQDDRQSDREDYDLVRGRAARQWLRSEPTEEAVVEMEGTEEGRWSQTKAEGVEVQAVRTATEKDTKGDRVRCVTKVGRETTRTV